MIPSKTTIKPVANEPYVIELSTGSTYIIKICGITERYLDAKVFGDLFTELNKINEYNRPVQHDFRTNHNHVKLYGLFDFMDEHPHIFFSTRLLADIDAA